MITSLEVIRRRRMFPVPSAVQKARPRIGHTRLDTGDAGPVLFGGHALRDEGMDGSDHFPSRDLQRFPEQRSALPRSGL